MTTCYCRLVARGRIAAAPWRITLSMSTSCICRVLPTSKVRLHLIHGSMDQPKYTPQTASRSTQPFLQGSRSLVTDRDTQTDHDATSVTVGCILCYALLFLFIDFRYFLFPTQVTEYVLFFLSLAHIPVILLSHISFRRP